VLLSDIDKTISLATIKNLTYVSRLNDDTDVP